MRKLETREIVLLVLLGAVVLVVAFVDWGDVTGADGDAAAEKEIEVGEAPEIRLARLGLDPADYDPGGRNLFRYGTPPRAAQPAPPPRPRPETVTRPQPVATPPPPPVRNLPTTPPKPQAPRPSFQYIGQLGPKDDRIAVFDEGDSVLLAQIGETIQDEFVLRSFGYRTVTLGYTDRRFAEQTTELEMKQPRRR